MARKSWDELTPTYRARLERAGVTAESHAAGKSIQTAVGHGWHLPSMRPRYERRMAAESARAAKLGMVSPGEAAATIADIGPDRAAVLLDWQTERTALGRGADKGGALTFEQYIENRFGEDAWDDDWQEIYDELDDSWDYYHD